MQDRLNFFEPWDRLPPTHENQLTRALLVVLRGCPIAHQSWLSLIDGSLRLSSLPRPSFDTQRGKVLKDEQQVTTDGPIKGISVFCIADVPSDATGTILESDRGQVLDGIIRYGDEIVVVMESKLDGPADDRQARSINMHGQPVIFSDEVRRISWRDVLASFTDLAHEGRGLVSGAERMILIDFLAFVATNFPSLGPFNTLERCEGEPSRITRRLKTILADVLGSEGPALPGIHLSVTTAYLDFEDRKHITLRLYPADTLQQARVFYGRHLIAENILALQDQGWTIMPNFHFGYMAKGFNWTNTTMSLAAYLQYWQANIQDTTQIDRQGWDDYWEKLVRLQIAAPSDRDDFDRDFTRTTRHSATPRPGIRCAFSWTLDDAARFDARSQLTQTVKQRINQFLEAIGEARIGG